MQALGFLTTGRTHLEKTDPDPTLQQIRMPAHELHLPLRQCLLLFPQKTGRNGDLTNVYRYPKIMILQHRPNNGREHGYEHHQRQ